jgi:Mrp family chromosome partitioning ATPase
MPDLTRVDLRRAYDYVVIDAASVLEGEDTDVLAQSADASSWRARGPLAGLTFVVLSTSSGQTPHGERFYSTRETPGLFLAPFLGKKP